MGLRRYRRLPRDRYRAIFGDADGQVLPLLWLGGCIFCLWVSAGAAVAVALLAGDLLLGLGVGLGGACLGLIVTTLLAVGVPALDARWLRLGSWAGFVYMLVPFAGAAVAVALGILALQGSPADVADPASSDAGMPMEREPTGFFDSPSRVGLALGLVVVVAGVLAKPVGRQVTQLRHTGR